MVTENTTLIVTLKLDAENFLDAVRKVRDEVEKPKSKRALNARKIMRAKEPNSVILTFGSALSENDMLDIMDALR